MVPKDPQEIPPSHQKWRSAEERAEKITRAPYSAKCLCTVPFSFLAWLFRHLKGVISKRP